jgi:site-specific DNA recombinase
MICQGSHVALYARVSSDHQAKAATIASQLAALKQRIENDGHSLNDELCFIDEGYSGGTLVRPSLERPRDMVYAGVIDILYVHSPDRLARKYAYQVLLIEEFNRTGMKTIFLNHGLGQSPEDDLLLQVQGVIAEYERTKILERARRGKRHAARLGSLAVMSAAPFGYRYVPKSQGGGEAQYQIILEEARIVRQMFQWVGCEGATLREVCRQLQKEGIKTRSGKSDWNPGTIAKMLVNSTYKGLAAYGKKRKIERQIQLRQRHLGPGQHRLSFSSYNTKREDQEFIPVTALVSEDLFEAAAQRLAENQRRNRERKTGAKYLLQGLLECARCGHAYTGRQSGKIRPGYQKDVYFYYRCCARDRHSVDDESRCDNESIRIMPLDDAVWQDACELLRDPERMKREYERRLAGEESAEPRTFRDAQTAIQEVKSGIGRLIDAYENGLLGKEEFEPRIRSRKERLDRLKKEAASLASLQEQQTELRMAIGQLETFKEQISAGSDSVDFMTKREIIRALVKRIEIDKEDVRIIYRISPHPFVRGPASGAILHNCRRRQDAFRRTLTDVYRSSFFTNSFIAAEGIADDSQLLRTHSSSFTQFLLATATAVAEARSAAQRRASFLRL